MDKENGAEPSGSAGGDRRTALIAMGKAIAYVPPVVATFAMGGLSVQSAYAYGGNLLP